MRFFGRRTLMDNNLLKELSPNLPELGYKIEIGLSNKSNERTIIPIESSAHDLQLKNVCQI